LNKKYVIGVPSEVRVINNLDRNVVNNPEVAAIIKHGGAPILIPTRNPELMVQYIDLIDGLLLPGGPDVAPQFYGEEPVPLLGDTDRLLDQSSIELTKLAIERHKPIFAICRGMQVVNVALGGTLYQDMGSQREKPVLQHYQKAPMDQGTHTISINADSYLAQIIGHDDKVYVNSHHHEAIKAVSSQLRFQPLLKMALLKALKALMTI